VLPSFARATDISSNGNSFQSVTHREKWINRPSHFCGLSIALAFRPLALKGALPLGEMARRSGCRSLAIDRDSTPKEGNSEKGPN